jgi:hypothetical protein
MATNTRGAALVLPEFNNCRVLERVGGQLGKGGTAMQEVSAEGLYYNLGILKDGRVFKLCGKCAFNGNTGHLPHYGGIYGGQCFECGGAGHVGLYANTVDEAKAKAAKSIRARRLREEREARKAAEAAARREAEFKKWVAKNAAWVKTVAAFVKTNKITKTIEDNGYVKDAHNDDILLLEFVEKILARSILTDKQIDYVNDLVERIGKRKARGAATRYAAAVGATIVFTAKVTHSISLEPKEVGYGHKSYQHMVILAGTGEWEGCTFKWVGTSDLAWKLAVDAEYKLSAAVKKHALRNDAKQTIITRAKLAR